MIVVESLQQRKLIGALDPGKDLVDELTRIAELQRLSSGEFSLTGRVRGVELVRFDGGNYLEIPLGGGDFDLVQLNGNVARMGDQVVLRLDALLAGWGPAGQQMVYGQIRAAEIVEVEFSLVAHDDVAAKRKLDAGSGQLRLASVEKVGGEAAAPASAPPERPRTPERIAEPKLTAAAAPAKPAPPRPASAPTPEPPAKTQAEPDADDISPTSGAEVSAVSWADAARVSDDIKPASKADKVKALKDRRKTTFDDFEDNDEDDKALLSPGDIIDHPKLGKCRVIKIEDEDYAHIRLKRGQIRKLALEVCEVTYVGDEDGRNLFKVRIKR